MSTAVAIKSETRPITHKISWGRSTWVCVHPYCDGSHHVYVSCAR
jgi:hypothetical protein